VNLQRLLPGQVSNIEQTAPGAFAMLHLNLRVNEGVLSGKFPPGKQTGWFTPSAVRHVPLSEDVESRRFSLAANYGG
jgi:hypothetical protein